MPDADGVERQEPATVSYRILLVSDGETSAAAALLVRVADRRRVSVTVVEGTGPTVRWEREPAIDDGHESTATDAGATPGGRHTSDDRARTVGRLIRAGFAVEGCPIGVRSAARIAQSARAGAHDLILLDVDRAASDHTLDAVTRTLVETAATPLVVVNAGTRDHPRLHGRPGEQASVLVGLDGSDSAALALLALTAFVDPATIRVAVMATGQVDGRVDIIHSAVATLVAAGFAAAAAYADGDAAAAFRRSAFHHHLTTLGVSRDDLSAHPGSRVAVASLVGVIPAVLIACEPA